MNETFVNTIPVGQDMHFIDRDGVYRFRSQFNGDRTDGDRTDGPVHVTGLGFEEYRCGRLLVHIKSDGSIAMLGPDKEIEENFFGKVVFGGKKNFHRDWLIL